jgi:hypothetical protein
MDGGAHVNSNTLQSLRLTLQHLEQTTGPTLAADDMAALQRLLLHRIAELEAISAPEAHAPDRVELL